MFKNDKKEMEIEYRVFKQGLQSQNGVTDADRFVYYVNMVQKSVKLYKTMGTFLMVVGVPLLFIGIGIVAIVAGFILRGWAGKQVKKYDYFKELASNDESLNHAT